VSKEKHPKPEYPASHEAGMRVPKGGSSCAKCRFLGRDGKTCDNYYWVEWNNGNNKLPAPADEYCSDWYESAKDIAGVKFEDVGL